MTWTPKEIDWYDRALSAGNYPENIIDFMDKKLEEKNNILDIGCGIGTFALPLARRGFSVTALDQSRPALNFLSKKSRENKLTDLIEVKYGDWHKLKGVKNKWDEIITAYTGQEIVGKVASLEKMNRAAASKVFLLVPGESIKHSFDSDKLFKRLGRKLRYHRCYYRDVENVLKKMGIDFKKRHFHYYFGQPFKNFGEAVDFFSNHYKIVDKEEIKVLRDFLQKRLIKKNNKLWINNYKKSTLFFWQVKEERQVLKQ